MSVCKVCGIEILDRTEKCPFCGMVLEGERSGAENGAPREPMYPNAAVAVRRFRLLERLVLFLSIAAVTVLILVNLLINGGLVWNRLAGWTVATALILLYVNTLLRLAITGQKGYQFKTLTMTILAIVILTGIDAATGYRGWALNYVLPGAVFFLDGVVCLLMILNRRNWQSYLMTELFQIFLSAVMVLLIGIGWITDPRVAGIAATASVLLFLGTVILGGRRARSELQRRFYI